MKFRYALFIYLIGYCFNFVGALFKIQHWQGASLLLTVATTMNVLGIIAIFVSIATNKKLRDIINW